MGKAEKGTPKDVANRMKAKGLQKLRWYCQMCEKQCRDENGFKCHTASETHQRQLLLFADDPDKYLDSFSEEFKEGYVSLLKRRFGTKRVQANNVYQEYIHDRHHVHMNSTQWETLTDFVKWLGREGICVVDETEKGWFVTYVDRDPETLLLQEKQRKRDKFERDEEERFQDFINRQVEQGRAKKADGESSKASFTELKRSEGELINLELSVAPKAKAKLLNEGSVNPLTMVVPKDNRPTKDKNSTASEKKRSVMEEVIEEDKRRQKRFKETQVQNPSQSRTSDGEAKTSWLCKDIFVKVITKELGSRYYKNKGVVLDVPQKYLSIVRLNDCGTKLKLDQTHLETVVPAVGRAVRLVGGAFRGCDATLKELHVDRFGATLELTSQSYKGKVLKDVPYEHFSKLNT